MRRSRKKLMARAFGGKRRRCKRSDRERESKNESSYHFGWNSCSGDLYLLSCLRLGQRLRNRCSNSYHRLIIFI
uniref:At5g43580 n=1 Tax=Arabidopsis thaliana TaxID=3702 RepID=Q6IDQ5_ARATH|nr:At5g43580 [Arabidopsis thaliana]AAU05501.1 At5g43580 [Arabidopsis thaliana]